MLNNFIRMASNADFCGFKKANKQMGVFAQMHPLPKKIVTLNLEQVKKVIKWKPGCQNGIPACKRVVIFSRKVRLISHCRLQSPVYEFEMDDQLKENKDKNKKSDESSLKTHKEKPKAKRNIHHQQDGGKSAHQPTKKSQPRMEAPQSAPVVSSKQSNFEALSLATEQTLKDINKWLDDTPKFDEFSSASNSPSYMALEDFDLLGAPRPMDIKKVPLHPICGFDKRFLSVSVLGWESRDACHAKPAGSAAP